MKATMDDAGAIVITAESSVESYALKHWTHENLVPAFSVGDTKEIYIRGSGLVVKITPEQPA